MILDVIKHVTEQASNKWILGTPEKGYLKQVLKIQMKTGSKLKSVKT